MKTLLKVLLGIVATSVIIVAIVVPLAVLMPSKTKWILLDKYRVSQKDGRPKFTLDDCFNDIYKYKTHNVRWISENEYLHKNVDGNILLYNIDTDTVSTLLSNSTFEQVKSDDYLLSPDEKFILLESNYTKTWRHSYTASYSIYDLSTGNFVSDAKLPHTIQYITWSTVGHKLVYVSNYNIYLKSEPKSAAIQITQNGEKNKIYNGIPDWLYEEEMFSSNSALWCSTGGRFFAYGEFNDTLVPLIEYSTYGDGQYPETTEITYSKAGANIPTVKLFVVDTTNMTNVQLPVPDNIKSSEYYLSSITWVTNERIAVQWIKRIQNYSSLVICDFVAPDSWDCKMKQSSIETSSTGWIGKFRPSEPFFTSDDTNFYKVMSNAEGYNHIHYVTGTKATPITMGKWEVISINALTKDTLYYISNEHEGYPGRRNLYKIGIGNQSEKKCITCDLDVNRGQYYSAYFSKSAKYYVLYCYGPGVPSVKLYNASTDQEIKTLEDNKELEDELRKIQIPTKVLKSLQLDGTKYWYQMFLPPNFDESKKYPLLIDVYGGPASQKADARFSIGWATYLASSEDIIVASFDGRGSGFQGDQIMHSLYRRLGTYEVEDQIRATRKFIELGYIDEKRIAIWGWSYGGYVTSMVLGAGSKVFKCGMAVAPVSNWTYYDAMYVERYMGLPTEADNLKFYRNSTVMQRAENFKLVDYLLIHGTADDNVHFQQAAQISKALVDNGVDFSAMWYTDKDHGLSGHANKHVYTHMSYFLKRCFSLT
uniref:Dipeptidyl peptidase 4-like protein n=1 Tax=Callorhinchus milii TaxID=7868 RepID=V9KA33_CALMI